MFSDHEVERSKQFATSPPQKKDKAHTALCELVPWDTTEGCRHTQSLPFEIRCPLLMWTEVELRL